MFLRSLKCSKGSIYPVSAVFFLSALILMSHAVAVYIIQYKTYDSLENLHRHATIQLLEEIAQHKIPE